MQPLVGISTPSSSANVARLQCQCGHGPNHMQFEACLSCKTSRCAYCSLQQVATKQSSLWVSLAEDAFNIQHVPSGTAEFRFQSTYVILSQSVGKSSRTQVNSRLVCIESCETNGCPGLNSATHHCGALGLSRKNDFAKYEKNDDFPATSSVQARMTSKCGRKQLLFAVRNLGSIIREGPGSAGKYMAGSRAN